jgi:isopentenyl-diphosphate Delta-isomerase
MSIFGMAGTQDLAHERARMKGDVKAQREDELFDVVDENDRVIRQARRVDVHRHGWWHRAVHALVFNQEGGVLLQKRSLWKDLAPGCWDSSCSGHLDAGEDYDAAIVRELGEELGLRGFAPPQRWRRLLACAETGWEFVWVYHLRHEGPFEVPPAEIDRVEWFDPAQVSEAILRQPAEYAPAFRHLWALLAPELVDGKAPSV